MTTAALRFSVFSRSSMRVLLLLIVALASVLYLEWRRSARAPVSAETQADTMCFASRIGLSCR